MMDILIWHLGTHQSTMDGRANTHGMFGFLDLTIDYKQNI